MLLKTIMKKELRNLIRDKKALISLFLPILIFPLIYSMLGSQLNGIEEKLEEEIRIYCNIQDDIEKKKQVQALLEGVSIAFIETSDPEQSLKNEEIYLILDFVEHDPNSFPLQLSIKYNTNSNISTSAYAAISAALNELNTEIVHSKLMEANIDPQVLYNIQVSGKSVATNSLLVVLAPMLVVSMLISGGVSIAVDVFAGERERGTMEQLMMTQVKRPILLCGKCLSVLVIALFSSFISILSYIIALCITPEFSELLELESTEAIKPESMLLLFGCIIAFAVFITLVLALISIIAKSSKGAQSMMSIIAVLPSILSMLIMFVPTSETHIFFMAMPIYGTLVSLKLVLSNALTLECFCITNISLIISSIVLFWICNKLFKQIHL